MHHRIERRTVVSRSIPLASNGQPPVLVAHWINFIDTSPSFEFFLYLKRSLFKLFKFLRLLSYAFFLDYLLRDFDTK